jgi:hypothetical protein
MLGFMEPSVSKLLLFSYHTSAELCKTSEMHLTSASYPSDQQELLTGFAAL